MRVNKFKRQTLNMIKNFLYLPNKIEIGLTNVFIAPTIVGTCFQFCVNALTIVD